MTRPAFFHSGGDVFANGPRPVFMDASEQQIAFGVIGEEITAYSILGDHERARSAARRGAQLIQARIAARQWRSIPTERTMTPEGLAGAEAYLNNVIERELSK